MKIIFCLSYLNIPNTIRIIEKSKSDFLIITYQDTIETFLKEIYSASHVLKIKKLSFYISRYLLRHVLLISYYKILYYNELIRKQSNCEIYFFFVTRGHFEAWMIHKLSKKNKIFYSPELNPNDTLIEKSIRAKFNKLFLKLIYKEEVIPVSNMPKQNYIMSSMFLNKINAKVINFDESNNASVKIVKQLAQKNKNNANIIFYSGAIVENNSVEKNEYCAKIDEIIEFIGKKNLVLKMHPRFPIKYSMEYELNEIPDYYPGNLIFYGYNTILGYSSAVLYESANAGIKTISLLDYFIPINEDVRNNFKSFLNKNLIKGNKILYPRNLNELISCLM